MTTARLSAIGPLARSISWLAAVSVAAIVAESKAARSTVPFDPLAVYGNAHRFAVMRNGETVGSHDLLFENTPRGFTVEARFELEIPFLFFTAYRYRYHSISEWREGRLFRLAADIDDDGERSRVLAERRADGNLQLSGPKGSSVAPASIFPTDHWHPGVVNQTQVLNTITGRVNSVEIRDLGDEEVETSQGSVRARHYLYTGQLNNEVWYESSGRWVKMRFPARDGSIIEYVCETCGSGN